MFPLILLLFLKIFFSIPGGGKIEEEVENEAENRELHQPSMQQRNVKSELKDSLLILSYVRSLYNRSLDQNIRIL